MTGQVPYYGGRLSPAQIYSLQHPNEPVPPTLQHPPMTRAASEPKESKDELEDLLGTVGQTFLAATINCASSIL